MLKYGKCLFCHTCCLVAGGGQVLLNWMHEVAVDEVRAAAPSRLLYIVWIRRRVSHLADWLLFRIRQNNAVQRFCFYFSSIYMSSIGVLSLLLLQFRTERHVCVIVCFSFPPAHTHFLQCPLALCDRMSSLCHRWVEPWPARTVFPPASWLQKRPRKRLPQNLNPPRKTKRGRKSGCKIRRLLALAQAGPPGGRLQAAGCHVTSTCDVALVSMLPSDVDMGAVSASMRSFNFCFKRKSTNHVCFPPAVDSGSYGRFGWLCYSHA
jgi:hypothetical protein